MSVKIYPDLPISDMFDYPHISTNTDSNIGTTLTFIDARF